MNADDPPVESNPAENQEASATDMPENHSVIPPEGSPVELTSAGESVPLEVTPENRVTTGSEPGLAGQVLDNLAGVMGSLLDRVHQTIEQHGTALLIGILTFFAAWLVASIIRSVTSKGLRAIGLDLIAERTGLRAYLAKHDIPTAPSRAVGWLVYFVILYTALVLVLDLLQLRAASELMRSVASYAPHVLAAILLIFLGILLGKWADYFVSRSARLASIPGHQLLGGCARLAVVLLAIVFAINSLGWVSQSILLGGFGLLLGCLLGVALLFSICARGLAESMLARSFLTLIYKPGDRLRIGQVEGVLTKIEACSVRLDCGDRMVVLPNRFLTEQSVEILPDKEEKPNR